MALSGPANSATSTWRRVRRWVAWLIGAPTALLLVLFVAWALSNLNDATPLPVPAELALPAPKVADERNAIYTLMGLFAAEDREPAQAGRERWKTELAWAATPVVNGKRADYPADPEGSRPELKRISGAPWECQAEGEACIAQWIAQKEALAAQREQARVWGARCERLLDGHFEYEQLLPPKLDALSLSMASVLPFVDCARWFSTGAVLAWAGGDRTETLRQLQRADMLRVHFLDGSRTLAASITALRVARRVEDSFAAIALRDAALAPQLADLLSHLPDVREVAKRWIATEAAFQRNIMTDLALELQGRDSGGGSWWARFTDAAADALSLQRFSIQIERTQQATNQLWLGNIARLGQPDLGASAQLPDIPGGRFFGWSWYNTTGQMLVDTSTLVYGSYFARHADAQLHHQVVALTLAIQAQRIPANEREKWTQQQDIPDALKQRLIWSDAGHQLAANPWVRAGSLASANSAPNGMAVQWPH